MAGPPSGQCRSVCDGFVDASRAACSEPLRQSSFQQFVDQLLQAQGPRALDEDDVVAAGEPPSKLGRLGAVI